VWTTSARWILLSSFSAPALAGDAQDHGGHGEADYGIEDPGARGYCDGAGDDGERDVCVGAGVIAVCDQRGAFQPVPSTGADHERDGAGTKESEHTQEFASAIVLFWP
jgi:hypothetical protein